jgi:hypothetical protein
MVVGNNESTTTKNIGKSLEISIAMQTRQYDGGHMAKMEHVQGFTGSHWMLPSGKCLCRIAPAAAMVNYLLKQHKTLTKHNF